MNRIFPPIFPPCPPQPNLFNGLTGPERIRDKIAASKKKGMWMGGVPPLGCRAQDGKLDIVDSEAQTVRLIFRRYAELGSVRLLKDELDARSIQSKLRKRIGSPARRQAIRPRRALFDAAKPDLSRRDRPQGAIPSW